MINLDSIKSVYSGRLGCACGCRGTHSESTISKNRILKVLNSNLSTKYEKPSGSFEGHFWVETDTRLYIAYEH